MTEPGTMCREETTGVVTLDLKSSVSWMKSIRIHPEQHQHGRNRNKVMKEI